MLLKRSRFSRFNLPLSLLDIVPGDHLPRVVIVDAMAVLQSMKKTPAMNKLSDFDEAFIKRIEWMMVGYNDGRVVFDRYLDQSEEYDTSEESNNIHRI